MIALQTAFDPATDDLRIIDLSDRNTRALGYDVPVYQCRMIKEHTETIAFKKISQPEDIVRIARSWLNTETLPQEHLLLFILNTKNNVVGLVDLYCGTLNHSVVRIAEVIRPAIILNAMALALAHNHPSGDATPSQEDIWVTKRIAEAAKLMDIDLLDHVVIGEHGFTSLKTLGVF